MARDNVIRMFWYGDSLSVYERLSIASFLKQGHRVEVFSYKDLRLPDGAVRVDAASILPESAVFISQHGVSKGTVAAFSDVFRYKLLYERGGIWSDTDVLCLRPLTDLPSNWVGRQDDSTVNGALMGFDAKHPLLGELYEQAIAAGKEVKWGQIGPHLFTRLLPNYSDVTILPPNALYPVHWSEAWRLMTSEDSSYCANLASDSYVVHWWNEIFRRIGIPKDKLPPATSYLGLYALLLLNDAAGESWSNTQIDIWVNNFRAANLAEPIKRYVEGQAEFADLLRDLGSERLSEGQFKQAVELLNTALQARPNGRYIRQLLSQALTGLENQEAQEKAN